MSRPQNQNCPQSSRRDFLKQTSTAAVVGSLASLSTARFAHAAGSDVIKFGLVGCGGRGTGAARDALSADPNNKLVAMGDAFEDRLQGSLRNLNRLGDLAKRVDVPPERQFVGFDAFKKVLEADIDVVLLCTPPHFRPEHLKAAVAAGKHIFAEKPVAVDAPGVRSVFETVAEAKKKNLTLVSGLCWRYHYGMRGTFEQIHSGTIGDIVTMQCNYLTGQLWSHPRREGWSDMEYQLRNWLYYTWLSGDHNVEQHIHSLDKMVWAMGDKPPLKAYGSGGRIQRTEELFGNIYDHHAVVYEFEGGVKCFSHCRQMNNTYREVKDYVMGTKGNVDVMGHRITGQNPWKFSGSKNNMYRTEHQELFASIRDGKPINNGDYMTKSTLMAIMGRMATYTGKEISWEQALNSQEDLSPKAYEWGPLAFPEVAVPGKTKFV